MSILIAAAGLMISFAGVVVLVKGRRDEATSGDGSSAREGSASSAAGSVSRSILSRSTVERSIASGAPPTPWMLRRQDREAMAAIEEYFARALPDPSPEGRPFIEESLGYGGPQLELRVPIISSRRSVAVIFRSWDARQGVLESNLYFAGTVNDRLARVASRAGFERTAFCDGISTVFRSRSGTERQRSA